MLRRLLIPAAVVVAAIVAYVLIAGWPGGGRKQQQQAAAPPAPEVGVVTVQPAEVPLPVQYAGRVVGFRDVEVRSLVGGRLLSRGFQEGGMVEKGQLLFQIDPAPYQVALSRAEAQLAQAQATLRQAEDNFTRTEELFRRGVATERQRDEATAARDQARASVQLAEAEIANAKLNLTYTQIHAPLSGATALESPAIGTVILSQQTLLTTITPLDTAYVHFSFTDEENRVFQELNAKRAKPLTEANLTVHLEFGDGRRYPQSGTIDSAASRVNPQTGTIQARAVFPNPNGDLLPGQFVRVLVSGITLPDAIVVPKQAISQGPQGPTVFVVAQGDIAEVRPVRLGFELPNGWIVREGLKGGDRVIVDGVIRVRAGAPVRPVPYTPEPAADVPAQGQR